MELLGVRVEVPANTPVLMLREQEGRQWLLPIYIGGPEATAIHYVLEGVTPPRPLTHDLFVNVLAALDTSLAAVVITEVHDHTYFAELHLTVGGESKVVSSRPSDAIALAVRSGTPIFASAELLDEVGQEPEPDPESEPPTEAIVDEFRDFIEHVNPDDFA